MSHILNDDDKPSVDDLIHFGVKGMKWGVRRNYEGATAIRSARKRVKAEKHKVKEQEDRVKGLKKGTAERSAGEKKLGQMKTSFLKNPDRATAARLTRGEFWATQVVGAAATVTVAPVAAPIAGAIGLGTYARRKTIARRQRNKSYDK